MDIVAERLREARLDKNMSQRAVSRKAGTTPNQICQYESANDAIRHVPSLFTAICIADVLDVSLDWLTGRTDKKEVNR